MKKNNKSRNQIILQEMIKIYKPNNCDWLNCYVTKNNPYSLHQIKKVSDGGILCVDNSALLTKISHRALHVCEKKDTILYSEINNFFKEIINVGDPLEDYFIQESKEYKRALMKTLYKR